MQPPTITPPTPDPKAPPPRSSISVAFETLPRTLRHGYDNIVPLAIMGMIWWLGAVLILPLGVVTAGLHRVTQRMSEERVVDWRDMLKGWRGDLGWASRLVVALVSGFFALSYVTLFYGIQPNGIVRYLSLTFLLFTFLWVGVMLVSFAMALRQEIPTLRRTLRNSIIMVFANGPSLVISLGFVIVTSIVLFVLPPLAILIPSWIALWSEEYVRLLLVRAGYLPPDEIADRVTPRRS